MDFGRLERVDGVSCALAPVVLRSPVLAADARGALDVRLGAPAWSKRSWLGRVYPVGTRPSELLAAYARAYRAVELNATFYALPSDRALEAWREATPASFRFCPKLPRAVSHARGLPVDGDALRATWRFLEALGERRGPALLQLPPSTSIADRGAVDRFVDAWPRSFALAVELRHPTWFATGRLDDRVADRLAERGVVAVITDVAGRRDVCHGTITAPEVLVRFVGNQHPSDASRLEAWAERLVALRAVGVRAAWFFVHQPDDEAAPETLALAAERFGSALGDPVSAWRPERLAAPGQLRLF